MSKNKYKPEKMTEKMTEASEADALEEKITDEVRQDVVVEIPDAGPAEEDLEALETAETPEAVPSEEAGATDAETPVTEEAPAGEGEYSAAEGTDASLLSEFAPKPMNIPNVDLEKEKKRQAKRDRNRSREKKKVEARKKRGKKSKKRSAGQKVAAAAASFLIFLIMIGTMSGFISVLSIQLATSRFVMGMAVSGMDVAEIPIDTPNYPALSETFGMVTSSSRAALVDLIRDNSQVAVTYDEILAGIKSSSLEEFLVRQLQSAKDYLLLDKPYTPVTGADISNVIKNNATLVRNLTGIILADGDYANIASYFEASGKLDNVSQQALSQTPLRQYTPVAKKLMDLKVLAGLLLINILLIVLLCVIGRGSAHIPIGWAFILSGIAVVIAGIMLRPSFTVASGFLQTVLNSYFTFFTGAVVVIAAAFAVVGAMIFLIGNAATDKDE